MINDLVYGSAPHLLMICWGRSSPKGSRLLVGNDERPSSLEEFSFFEEELSDTAVPRATVKEDKDWFLKCLKRRSAVAGRDCTSLNSNNGRTTQDFSKDWEEGSCVCCSWGSRGPWIGWLDPVFNFKSCCGAPSSVCLQEGIWNFVILHLQQIFAIFHRRAPPSVSLQQVPHCIAWINKRLPKYSDQCTIAWIRRGGGLDFSRVGWERRVSKADKPFGILKRGCSLCVTTPGWKPQARSRGTKLFRWWWWSEKSNDCTENRPKRSNNEAQACGGQKHDGTFEPATSIFICDSQLNPRLVPRETLAFRRKISDGKIFRGDGNVFEGTLVAQKKSLGTGGLHDDLTDQGRLRGKVLWIQSSHHLLTIWLPRGSGVWQRLREHCFPFILSQDSKLPMNGDNSNDAMIGFHR